MQVKEVRFKQVTLTVGELKDLLVDMPPEIIELIDNINNEAEIAKYYNVEYGLKLSPEAHCITREDADSFLMSTLSLDKLIEIIDEPPESLASTEMLLDSDKRCDIQDEFFKRYNKLPSPEIQSDITNLIFLVAEQQLTQCQSIIAKKYESEINKLRAQITELTK